MFSFENIYQNFHICSFVTDFGLPGHSWLYLYHKNYQINGKLEYRSLSVHHRLLKKPRFFTSKSFCRNYRNIEIKTWKVETIKNVIMLDYWINTKILNIFVFNIIFYLLQQIFPAKIKWSLGKPFSHRHPYGP